MGENGYFAGETEDGRWEIFEVGPRVATCATEDEAMAETDRLTLREAERLEQRARALRSDADTADDFGEHVGVVRSVRRRADELFKRAKELRESVATPEQEGSNG